jgi:hypothetical protein
MLSDSLSSISLCAVVPVGVFLHFIDYKQLVLTACQILRSHVMAEVREALLNRGYD